MAFSKLNQIQTLDNELNDINASILSLRIFIIRLIETIEKSNDMKDFIKFYGITEKTLADFYSVHNGNISELNLQEKFCYKINFQKIETLYLNVIYIFDKYLTTRQNKNLNKIALKLLPNVADFKAFAIYYKLFEIVIHLNFSIKDNDKLFFLKTSLVGSAVEMINYPNISYNAAWDIITKNYNEYCIEEYKNYAKLITDISLINNSLENLRKLWKRVQIYIKLLENLNHTSFKCYTLFTLFIVSKFDDITKNNWKFYINNRQSTLEEIEKFLSLHFICKQNESMLADYEIDKLSEINDQQNSNSADENPMNVENNSKSLLNEYLLNISVSFFEICTTLVAMKEDRLFKNHAAQMKNYELQDENYEFQQKFHNNSTSSSIYYECFQANDKISERNITENVHELGLTSDFTHSDRKNYENQHVLNETFQRNTETMKTDFNFPTEFEANNEDTNKEKFNFNKTLHSDVELKNAFMRFASGANEEDNANQSGINIVMQTDATNMNSNFGNSSSFLINNENPTANQILLNVSIHPSTDEIHPSTDEQILNARFPSHFPTKQTDTNANQFSIHDRQQNFTSYELNPLQRYSLKDDNVEFQSTVTKSSTAENAPAAPNLRYTTLNECRNAGLSTISVQEENGCSYSQNEANTERNLTSFWFQFMYYTLALAMVNGIIFWQWNTINLSESD
ncbi:hypothetical protein O3M35_006897 [Rhynocoris fuscipes]|uniref:Uncharacterized protein n=1 Tax=Rhynocoris fuscipes TaxID=488301 RepID=A0AAW1DF56_9HEMI